MGAMDIPRDLYTGLDYFVSTQGKCAALASILSSQ